MEEAALAYWDLLEGKDKPVFGSTCKYGCQNPPRSHSFIQASQHSLQRSSHPTTQSLEKHTKLFPSFPAESSRHARDGSDSD